MRGSAPIGNVIGSEIMKNGNRSSAPLPSWCHQIAQTGEQNHAQRNASQKRAEEHPAMSSRRARCVTIVPASATRRRAPGPLPHCPGETQVPGSSVIAAITPRFAGLYKCLPLIRRTNFDDIARRPARGGCVPTARRCATQGQAAAGYDRGPGVLSAAGRAVEPERLCRESGGERQSDLQRLHRKIAQQHAGRQQGSEEEDLENAGVARQPVARLRVEPLQAREPRRGDHRHSRSHHFGADTACTFMRPRMSFKSHAVRLASVCASRS